VNGIEEKVNTMWPWFMGNGNKGAGIRLQELEDLANGKEDTATMKALKNHLVQHDKISDRRWELYVGFILIITLQILAYIFK